MAVLDAFRLACQVRACRVVDLDMFSITRSSSREDRLRVPLLFSVVYFSRGTLPTKRTGKRALGDLEKLAQTWRIPRDSIHATPSPLATSSGLWVLGAGAGARRRPEPGTRAFWPAQPDGREGP